MSCVIRILSSRRPICALPEEAVSVEGSRVSRTGTPKALANCRSESRSGAAGELESEEEEEAEPEISDEAAVLELAAGGGGPAGAAAGPAEEGRALSCTVPEGAEFTTCGGAGGGFAEPPRAGPAAGATELGAEDAVVELVPVEAAVVVELVPAAPS